jgi:hypothetical protein
MAQDTLVNRDVLLDEHRSSVKLTISKRRNIERLKSSSTIKADKVDEALDELDEVCLSILLRSFGSPDLPTTDGGVK